jgi:transposase-like protein
MREGRGRYTEALKRYVVSEVESGKMSQVEANERYGILGHSTILKWQRRYGKRAGGPTRMKGTNAMTEQEIELIRLRKENEALKRDLADERFKNIVWETMVEVAERELKIPIRKKYGAKRSAR